VRACETGLWVNAADGFFTVLPQNTAEFYQAKLRGHSCGPGIAGRLPIRTPDRCQRGAAAYIADRCIAEPPPPPRRARRSQVRLWRGGCGWPAQVGVGMGALHLRLAVVFAAASTAAGHGLMVFPGPRTGTTEAGDNKQPLVGPNVGVDIGPCGSGTLLNTMNTPNITVLAGATLEVSWQCNIVHDAQACHIRLSANATQGKPPTESFADIASGKFTCCVAPGKESRRVRIPPNAPHGPAVLQWTWDGDSMYYDCADIFVNNPNGGGYFSSPFQVYKIDDPNDGVNTLGLAVGLLIWVPVVAFTAVYYLHMRGAQAPAAGADGQLVDSRTWEQKMHDFWYQFANSKCGPVPLFPYFGHFTWFAVLATQATMSIVLLLAVGAKDPGGWADGAKKLRMFNCILSACISGLGECAAVMHMLCCCCGPVPLEIHAADAHAGACVMAKEGLSQFDVLVDLGQFTSQDSFYSWISWSYKAIAAQARCLPCYSIASAFLSSSFGQQEALFRVPADRLGSRRPHGLTIVTGV
jgi:hypothetical protein